MPRNSELGLPVPDTDDDGNGPIYQPKLAMDLAKSAAAACRTCGKKFVKGEPRMAAIFTTFNHDGGHWYDSTTNYYYHVKCGCANTNFTKNVTVKEIHGLSAMPKKEQDMVKKAFPTKLATAKAVAKPKAQPKVVAKRPAGADDTCFLSKVARKASSGSAKPGTIPAGSGVNPSLFDSKKAVVSAWTNDKLKKLLKSNDQSQTGNKQVLIAKCAFGLAYGKLPRCPECHGGTIKFRVLDENGELASLTTLYGGASGKDEEEGKAAAGTKLFYCSGYFDDDEKVECEWQGDSVDFENFDSGDA
jgi:hypothetical protein